MENKKILLIENQYRQFNRIKTYLNGTRYTVFPKDEESDTFDEFINYVRIYLNPRYGGTNEGSRRKDVFERIVNKIKRGNFDLLLIDYILVGCSAGLTGIFIAKELRDIGITTPIIFLSREKSNQPEITNNLNKNLEPYEWIHKGFDGREILDETYFNSYVIKGIKKCIGKSVSQLLNEITKSKTFIGKNDFKTRIVNLLKKDIRISRGKRIELEEFVKTIGQKTSHNLETLLKSIENGSE